MWSPRSTLPSLMGTILASFVLVPCSTSSPFVSRGPPSSAEPRDRGLHARPTAGSQLALQRPRPPSCALLPPLARPAETADVPSFETRARRGAPVVRLARFGPAATQALPLLSSTRLDALRLFVKSTDSRTDTAASLDQATSERVEQTKRVARRAPFSERKTSPSSWCSAQCPSASAQDSHQVPPHD
ncbi:hypothetical protein DMC30DRAFT_394267 [Rhodotorula diobovata]|uniref:Secreted protein n=1 Tax=Rhodotorula diobovata TaxID=5288 RepID=A0A5C5FXZ1_9BASI|nr:hypothetical protein DMC30DRAFT_394267 [Rhodotorula diobovata]